MKKDKAKEIYLNKKCKLVDSLINEDNTSLDLSVKLTEPYKTMYNKAKTTQADFLTNIEYWEKVDVYIYENETEKYLFFDISFKLSEDGEVEIFTVACYEYQGACSILGKI